MAPLQSRYTASSFFGMLGAYESSVSFKWDPHSFFTPFVLFLRETPYAVQDPPLSCDANLCPVELDLPKNEQVPLRKYISSNGPRNTPRCARLILRSTSSANRVPWGGRINNRTKCSDRHLRHLRNSCERFAALFVLSHHVYVQCDTAAHDLRNVR